MFDKQAWMESTSFSYDASVWTALAPLPVRPNPGKSRALALGTARRRAIRPSLHSRPLGSHATPLGQPLPCSSADSQRFRRGALGSASPCTPSPLHHDAHWREPADRHPGCVCCVGEKSPPGLPAEGRCLAHVKQLTCKLTVIRFSVEVLIGSCRHNKTFKHTRFD